MTVITKEHVKERLPQRPDDANKGTMGTLLNISGSHSMAGACILSSLSALRSGVGLLKIALPQSIYPIVASSVYEAVYAVVADSKSGTVDENSIDYLLFESKNAKAVLLGCGLKCCGETADFVTHFVTLCQTPMLIDADGINSLSMNIDVLKQRGSDIVLTPHIKEMSRLTGLSVEHILSDRQNVAESFAREHSVVLVLKGKDTIVTDGSATFVNPTGNCGMAKGGSGDVLSGIIASLMAQGLKPIDAACCGVYIHGVAGDIAAKKLSKTAMLPSDIIANLPQTFLKIEE